MISEKGFLPTEKYVDHRRRIRRVYSSEDGQMELFNLLHDMGLFRVITPDELDARNRAVLKAEELGLLDERTIRDTLNELLTKGRIDNYEDEKLKEVRKRKESSNAF